MMMMMMMTAFDLTTRYGSFPPSRRRRRRRLSSSRSHAHSRAIRIASTPSSRRRGRFYRLDALCFPIHSIQNRMTKQLQIIHVPAGSCPLGETRTVVRQRVTPPPAPFASSRSRAKRETRNATDGENLGFYSSSRSSPSRPSWSRTASVIRSIVIRVVG